MCLCYYYNGPCFWLQWEVQRGLMISSRSHSCRWQTRPLYQQPTWMELLPCAQLLPAVTSGMLAILPGRQRYQLPSWTTQRVTQLHLSYPQTPSSCTEMELVTSGKTQTVALQKLTSLSSHPKSCGVSMQLRAEVMVLKRQASGQEEWANETKAQ